MFVTVEDFDLAYADTGLNSHVNIFNLYGPYSSYFCSICSPDGTIAFPSDGGRAHCIIEFIYYEVHVLCETHHDDNSYNFLKPTVR